MQNKVKKDFGHRSDGRIRQRVRGLTKSKTGRAVGVTSLAAPVIGFIINDLRKHNSITRQLLNKAVKKLLKQKFEKVEVIDITDKFEIWGKEDNGKLINNYTKIGEQDAKR